MFNLDQLNSQLDLKNLDIAKLTKLASEHQNSFIKIVLIVGSLVIAGVLFNDYHVKDQDEHAKITELQGKLDAMKSREQAVTDLDNFKSSMSKKINEYELITQMSNYAKLCHVTITSLSPAESKDMGLYDLINVNFNAVSDNFKDLMLFFRKVEKSEYSLRINSWSGREADDGRVVFTIEISAVNIHP